jgi:hypothetical protein
MMSEMETRSAGMALKPPREDRAARACARAQGKLGRMLDGSGRCAGDARCSR